MYSPQASETKASTGGVEGSHSNADQINAQPSTEEVEIPEDGEVVETVEETVVTTGETPQYSGQGTIAINQQGVHDQIKVETAPRQQTNYQMPAQKEYPMQPQLEGIAMSSFDSHLSVEVKGNGRKLRVMQSFKKTKGASYMWSGSRATFGVQGPACTFFEVRITEHLPVPKKGGPPWAQGHKHLGRVGWSTPDATLFLGEDNQSFGYGGTGCKSIGDQYTKYGPSYSKGDIIGCFLDKMNGTITYTKNGKDLGQAFKISQELMLKPLFPHVLLKNVGCEVNFGPVPWKSRPVSLQSYCLIGNLSKEYMVAGPSPPPRSQCQVIMMIGLPACGKTTWVEKFMKENKDIAKFDVLGTNAIMEQMKVPGLKKKRAYNARWEHLIRMATTVFNELLLKRAPKRPRHYIIDQTNVYQTARHRKMLPFQEAGFNTKGVVIINTEEELARRSAQREMDEGKMVPQQAVDEMRVNFVLPSPNEFDEIMYIEESREFAEQMLKDTVPAAKERLSSSGKGKRNSAPVLDTEEQKQVMCPQQHVLQSFLTEDGNWECINCPEKTIPTGDFLFGCRECDYDVCGTCMDAIKQKAVCPKQHVLKSFLAEDDNWKCTNCPDKTIPKGHQLFGCRECDYDICSTCMDSIKEKAENVKRTGQQTAPGKTIGKGKRKLKGKNKNNKGNKKKQKQANHQKRKQTKKRKCQQQQQKKVSESNKKKKVKSGSNVLPAPLMQQQSPRYQQMMPLVPNVVVPISQPGSSGQLMLGHPQFWPR